MSPIPTELNSADIGTKGLTRNRLFGLLYMLKMINSAGDRVGFEEYKELEHRERMRKGTQKVLKNKNLHVGLIWLLSNLESVAGSPTEEANNEEGDGWTWILLMLVTNGALSLIEWLRQHLLKATGMTLDYIGVTFSKMIKEIMKYKNDERKIHDKTTQTEGVERDDEKEEMETKIFQLDTYIEELEDSISKLKEQRSMVLQECWLASEHGKRLMERSLKYRTCQNGRKFHFEAGCPHFAGASGIGLCAMCLRVEGVSRHESIPETDPQT